MTSLRDQFLLDRAIPRRLVRLPGGGEVLLPITSEEFHPTRAPPPVIPGKAPSFCWYDVGGFPDGRARWPPAKLGPYDRPPHLSGGVVWRWR